MSTTIIDENITRIKKNIADSYDICETKGATIPENKNLNNLPDTIASITGGSSYTFPVNGMIKEYTVASGQKIRANSFVYCNGSTVYNYTDIISGVANTSGNEAETIEVYVPEFPPSSVTNLKLKGSDTKILITWTDPIESYWAGTKVVYKTGSYPTDVNDGTLVINSTTKNAYSSTSLKVVGLENGTTYYFKLFPYAQDGSINRSSNNNGEATPVETPQQLYELTVIDSKQTTSLSYSRFS